MCKVDDLIGFIEQQLSDDETDNENCTWTKGLILEYIHNAILNVASDRSDLFTVTKTITLKPGCIHYICDDCVKFGDVISVDGNDCEPETNSTARTRRLSSRLSGNACLSANNADLPGTYRHGGIEFDERNPCVFRTTNPVPKRGVEATIYCSEIPNVDNVKQGGDLPSIACGETRPAILEFVYYQAYSKDIESVQLTDRATTHFNNYLQLLGLSRRNRDEYNGDNNQ